MLVLIVYSEDFLGEKYMKVLVLSVTAGQGHNSTAKAICAYFESIGCHAEMLDTMDYVSKILGETISKGYLMVASNAKLAYKSGYRLAELRKKSNSVFSPTRATGNAMAKKLLKYINSYDPDIILCTHVFPCIMLDVLKEKGTLRAKTIGVLTDFMFHPYWEESTGLDYMVIPNEQLILQGLRKGFKNEQLLPFGIPIHPKFSQSAEKSQARADLGLDINKRTVLFMSGGAGYGNIEKIVAAIDRVPFDFQLISVCGNNKDAKAKIDAMKTKKRVLNLGFVNNIDQLMDAADCIISKPGGLTTSEAMAKGLPMVIVNPIPGQEERNVEFLTNNGVAMAVTSTSTLEDVMYQLLANSHRIETMKNAIDIIAKPNSTKDICEFAKSLAERS